MALKGLVESSIGPETSSRKRVSRNGFVSMKLGVLVVLHPQMRDLLLAHQPAQGVLQLRLLNEQVVLRIDARRVLRTLEIQREPFLDSFEPRALRQVREQDEVEHEGCGKDRVPA